MPLDPQSNRLSNLFQGSRSSWTCFCHCLGLQWRYVFFLVYKFELLIFSIGKVGWVTQLVVDTTVRKRYVATQLLQTLKRHAIFQDVTAIGLVSSHPAAVNALTKYSCK